MKRILFVCYGGGHVNMLVPLILKANADPFYEVTVLGLTTSGAVLKKHNISYVGFKDLTQEGDNVALEYGRELAANMPAGGSVCYEETVAYLGLSFMDLVNKHGLDKAKADYNHKGRQAFLPTTIMERLFDKTQPHLLVSTNSPRAERAAFIVARNRGLLGVCIVGLFARHEIEWIGERGFSSRICVLSESVKKHFLSVGRKSDEIVVTGNPALDRLARPMLAEEASLFRRQRGWGNKKVILWASQPEPDRHPFTGLKADPSLPRRVDKALLQAVDLHPDWQLVIRYHPGETVDQVNWPDQAYISTFQDDLAILLQSVDVVVTMTSTVGLEGLSLGKPLVTVEESVFRDDAPYAKMGLSRGVANLSDIEAAIFDVISGGFEPKEKLPEVGTATNHVYNVMNKLLHEHSSNAC